MEKITDIGQIVSLCQTMTNLKLDITCGADRLFSQRWYEERYLTGQHTRYVMKPGLFINSIEDGRVYRAFNTSDEKAVYFMESNENYREYFIDMQAEAVTIPELGGEEQPEEVVEPESPESPEEVVEPEAVAMMAAVEEPELTEEEIAAAKRSEAAKKAAATRAANKAAATRAANKAAAEEAAAAEGLKEFEE